MQPDPKQESSKATVGVEVPPSAEMIIAAENRLRERYPYILKDLAVSPRSLVQHALAAALPHVPEAIRSEEREKVLGEVRKAFRQTAVIKAATQSSEPSSTAGGLAAEQQRDRLLEAVAKHCEIQGGADYETPDRDLYELAEEVEKEKEHGH